MVQAEAHDRATLVVHAASIGAYIMPCRFFIGQSLPSSEEIGLCQLWCCG